ncbi:hypothetical protein [Haliangium ochraceum]|uniref:Uncharacterized protein n=1 Tax=Haliangium ochraceum (strain DSM 14365 / JCM 11303 / SMP-2) TaxID=502025 RepID=D0LI79_HALO1|nr:hypothetical protein [Haliangium ochraceum]ACY16458.1 hypothetical protein Hoch_3959 [Haliangium ochraceum DSM 14365]
MTASPTPRSALARSRRLCSCSLLALALVVGAFSVLSARPASAAPQAQPPADSAAPAADDADSVGEDGEGEDAEGESAAEDAAPDTEALDIDALRQEYLRLRDELFRSRARAAAVASALYSTQLRVFLDYESARFFTITRSAVRIDGAKVFEDSSGAIGADRAVRFEGFVAPGSHRVAVRIEAIGKDDERFSSTVDNEFAIEAPPGSDVIVRIRARDAGDIAYAWEKKQRGSYKLELDIQVETKARPGAAPAKAATRAPAPAASPANAAATRTLARAGADEDRAQP